MENYDYMKSKLNEVKSSRNSVNKSIYQKIKKLYIEYNCWTWDKNYNLNDYDIFLKFLILKKHKNFCNEPIYGNYVFPKI